MESCNSQDHTLATLVRRSDTHEAMKAFGIYTIECRDSQGNVKWQQIAHNVIPDQGKNNMLDVYFGAGTPPTTWYMSLITAGTATSSSTYATPIITETTSSVIANRVAMTWSGSSAGSKSATTTSFSVIGTATITGNMVVAGGSGVTTVGNTTAVGGVLFSAANFVGGSKPVNNGDTLNVVYSVAV